MNLTAWGCFGAATICAIAGITDHDSFATVLAGVNVFLGGISYEFGKRKDGP